MAGESVLLNLSSELYFSQNATATQMFSALTESESIAAAYARLQEQYAVEPERLQQDFLLNPDMRVLVVSYGGVAAKRPVQWLTEAGHEVCLVSEADFFPDKHPENYRFFPSQRTLEAEAALS